MGDMGVIDELKGGAGVDWCGLGFGLERTKRIRSMEYLGYGRGYQLVGGSRVLMFKK
jgi:hypothetical protein